jgi:hypothetical protein
MTFLAIRAIDLIEGDLVDLEGDQYADPDNDNQIYPYLLHTVSNVEHERNSFDVITCIAVTFEGGPTIGFPIDHQLRVETE